MYLAPYIYIYRLFEYTTDVNYYLQTHFGPHSSYETHFKGL